MSFSPQVHLGELSEAARPFAAQLVADRATTRLFARDASLWGAEAESEASVRLGWTDAPLRAQSLVDEVAELRATFAQQGIHRIVLCGMGGSSLAPEVIARRDGVALTILDSTHPVTVARVTGSDLSQTAVMVSSKSGSTIETRSHLATFEQRFRDAGIDPSARIVIVTDPGSELHQLAAARNYHLFLADETVGGRFSALTAFGIVPAGLAGADVHQLVAEATAATADLHIDSPENPAIQLAAGMFAGLPSRYACVLTDADNIGLGEWIEQLVAESTGKQGHGVLPIAVPNSAPETSGALPHTATLVALTSEALPAATSPEAITVSAPLGAQFMLWETATALLCRLLQVNPFDQPDVESAKVAARSALSHDLGVTPVRTLAADDAPTLQLLTDPGHDSATLKAALEALRTAVSPDGYLAIHAYLDGLPIAAELQRLRDAFVSLWQVPTTLGWGPRFLHSTGQLHKGGPAVGTYLQLLDEPQCDVEIPGQDAGFARLIAAQAQGDRDVLIERGRPVLSVQAADAAQLVRDIENALRAA